MKRLATLFGVLALVGVISVVAVGSAFAQTETPQTPAPTTPAEPAAPRLKLFGRGFGLGGSTATFDAAATALNLTPTQLFEQLHSGKTLEEIAEAKGVDIETVQTAIEASRTQALKDKIAQAVEDGTITQEQADWMLQGIEKGYTGKMGGFGFGGRGGHGHGMRGGVLGGDTNKTPSTPATPSTGTSS